MNDLRLDSHKLLFHPQKLTQWLEGDTVYPINAEIGICGTCNHRCTFCSVDNMGYKSTMLDTNTLLYNLKLMHNHGLKSVNLAGNGEPLLHKDASYIINSSKEIGLDIGLTTNGVFFNKETARECMSSLTWVRFSTSAATNETYNKIHRGKEKDLEIVFENIANAVEIKRKNNLTTTLGLQIVLLPENIHEVTMLGKAAKELGIDYYTIKSYGIRKLSTSSLKDEFNMNFYDNINIIEEELLSLNSNTFKAYVRINRINNVKVEKTYNSCYAQPFFTFMDSLGNIWPCCELMEYEDVLYGNINNQNFIDIWNSEQRKKILSLLDNKYISTCSNDCRLNEMNKYLEQLKNPGLHANFI